MKTVWKYELNDDLFNGYQIIGMPFDAEILTAQLQNDKLVLWVLVDPARGLEGRRILVYGTGYDIYQSNLDFIAVVQAGDLVLHVFEQVVNYSLD